MTYVRDKCSVIICLFLKSTLIVFYHGYLMKSDLVATGCSFRHSRGPGCGLRHFLDSRQPVSGGKTCPSVHALCRPSGFFSQFLRGQTPLLFSGFLVESDANVTQTAQIFHDIL